MKKVISALSCVLLMSIAAAATAGTLTTLPTASSGAMMQRLQGAHWISAGAKSSSRVVYVFMDADCPYCHDLWQAMKSVRAADVQLRYLLVAVIDAESRGKDGAILESKDPAVTLEQYERDFERGGIAPKAKLQKSTQETIFVNERLMSALGIFGTPGLVYLAQNNEVEVFSGMPGPDQLKAIVGKR